MYLYIYPRSCHSTVHVLTHPMNVPKAHAVIIHFSALDR